jgi:hypothetical protein
VDSCGVFGSVAKDCDNEDPDERAAQPQGTGGRLDRADQNLAHPRDENSAYCQNGCAAPDGPKGFGVILCLMRARKQRRVRDQAEGKKQGIEDQQHDRYRYAERHQSGARLIAERRLVRRRQDQGDRRQRHHRRLSPCSLRIEALLAVPQAACHYRGTQHQQDVADNGAGNRRLDDVVETLAQSSESNDQFGGIAEGCVEKAAHAFAQAPGDLLGCPTHPGRQWKDGKAGTDKDHKMTVGFEMLEGDRNRDEDQKPIHVAITFAPVIAGSEAASAPPVFPIDPFHAVGFCVRVDRRAERRKEALVTETLHEFEALELVLDRVLEFGEAHFDVRCAQSVMQLTERIGCRDVYACDRFCGNHDATYLCR